MRTSDNCKDGASKSNNDEVCDKVNDMLQNMSTGDKNVAVCANCGKSEEDDDNSLKSCTACKLIKNCMIPIISGVVYNHTNKYIG